MMNKNEQIDSTKCFFISSHVNPENRGKNTASQAVEEVE